MRILIAATSTVLVLCGALAAQDPYEKEEASLASNVSARLVSFARTAERNKVFSRAKEAYDLVIDYYDADNAAARRALGYKKTRDGWEDPDEPKRWPDDADDERRWKVVTEWNRIAQSACEKHRELGMKLLGEVPLRGVYHLHRALWFDPFDVESHQALEHIEHDGFWGTAEEVAFVQRLLELEKHAIELAKRDYPVEPVTELPVELKRMIDDDADIAFSGARSDTFTIFTRGTQKNADDLVKWAERAVDFLDFCLPDDIRPKVKLRALAKRQWDWMGFVWTNAEMKAFKRVNPQLESSESFRNVLWHTSGGLCDVTSLLTPASMQDVLIGRIWASMLGGNDCLSEGAVHAATWYLKATCIYRRGAEDDGTTTGKVVVLPDAANWWMREIREQARSKTDFPANGLPRVRLARFLNDARLKTWSFTTWLLARYPQRWLKWVQKWDDMNVVPFPEHVDEYALELFERPLAEIEAEWRDWAAGRNAVASATGYGPPLVPEVPNDAQIKGLARVNEFRDLAGLSPCEIDQEATVGCKAHALYLQRYEDQWVWPEAHEEDPAREGFTTRGMRAGLRSVIVIGGNPTQDLDPTDSIDQWVGTVYHRFPLLEDNIRRIGFACEGNVCVLDMGSLEEPRVIENGKTTTNKSWLPWPPDGLDNVPLAFHYDEHPDPLDDTPEGAGESFDAQRKSGYPVSLQLGNHIATQLEDTSIALYECKKRGRGYETDAVVSCYVHTPKVPLLKRMEATNVVFAIPKEHLKPNTVYEVVVSLKVLAGTDTVSWRFKTGTTRTGHGRTKIDPKIAKEPIGGR